MKINMQYAVFDLKKMSADELANDLNEAAHKGWRFKGGAGKRFAVLARKIKIQDEGDTD